MFSEHSKYQFFLWFLKAFSWLCVNTLRKLLQSLWECCFWIFFWNKKQHMITCIRLQKSCHFSHICWFQDRQDQWHDTPTDMSMCVSSRFRCGSLWFANKWLKSLLWCIFSFSESVIVWNGVACSYSFSTVNNFSVLINHSFEPASTDHYCIRFPGVWDAVHVKLAHATSVLIGS